MKNEPFNSRLLSEVEQPLQDAYTYAKERFEEEYKQYAIKLSSTYRNDTYQFELYKKGRKYDEGTMLWVIVEPKKVVTHKDGFLRKSKHQFRKAIDVFLLDKETRQANWTDIEAYTYFAVLMKEYDPAIVWGGHWKSPYDPFHFEVA